MELLNVVKAEDVLLGKEDTGMNILVIGGGMIGAETASYLSVQCKASVGLTTRQAEICPDMEGGIRDDLKDILDRYFVKRYPLTTLKEVTSEGAILSTKVPGEHPKEWLYPCDTIVTAFGTEAYNPLSEKLIGKCETVVVGDALEARMALQAVREGFVAGFNA
jgi:pyruvate/2-oxoglutarate dehydrogenase complex dihydrolipoamide dehydrogenase (E3) component